MAKFPLPKTIETLQILDRILLSKADYDALMSSGEDKKLDTPFAEDEKIDQREYQRRVVAEQRERSIASVLGTSIGFEVVILGICCLIFARRDF